jgi:xanthine dehydrogenase YagS FAD-binding subunit
VSAQPARDALLGATGVVRAGGTDLTERRRHGHEPGPLVDLRRAELTGISVEQDLLTIGATTPIAQVAADPQVRERAPALAAAAGALATPQIRAVATAGGNLLQRNRCAFFRLADPRCHQRGGDSCPARAGDALRMSCFDLGPCVVPHPSTLALALLAHDGAWVQTASGQHLEISDLLGDGADPRVDHHLPHGEIAIAIHVPLDPGAERGAYHRAIARAYAEWPLVETAVRVQLTDGAVRLARVVVGGVARVPLRRHAVEDALVGGPLSAERIATAAALAVEGANPLPETAYKLALLAGSVATALERAAEAS